MDPPGRVRGWRANARVPRAWLARNAGVLADGPIVDDILARGPELWGIVRRLQLPVLLVRGGRRSALHDDDVERFARLTTHGVTASIRGPAISWPATLRHPSPG